MTSDYLLGPFGSLLAQVTLSVQASGHVSLDWSILRHMRRTASSAYQQGRPLGPLHDPADLAQASAWHCLDAWANAHEDPSTISQQLKWISLTHWVTLEECLRSHMTKGARC